MVQSKQLLRVLVRTDRLLNQLIRLACPDLLARAFIPLKVLAECRALGCFTEAAQLGHADAHLEPCVLCIVRVLVHQVHVKVFLNEHLLVALILIQLDLILNKLYRLCLHFLLLLPLQRDAQRLMARTQPLDSFFVHNP